MSEELANKLYDKLFIEETTLCDGGFTGIDSATLCHDKERWSIDFDYDDGNGMKSYSLILKEESK